MVLVDSSSSKCKCVTCQSLDSKYVGGSSTGYQSGCQGPKCDKTAKDCAASGLVLINSYSPDCKCVSCDTNTNYTGKSKDGTYGGCDPLKCEKTADDCKKDGGKVLVNSWSPECYCITCSEYSSMYKGQSSNGLPSGCESAGSESNSNSGCQVKQEDCAAQGLVFMGSTLCRCEPCSYYGEYYAGAKSHDGTRNGCDWCW